MAPRAEVTKEIKVLSLYKFPSAAMSFGAQFESNNQRGFRFDTAGKVCGIPQASFYRKQLPRLKLLQPIVDAYDVSGCESAHEKRVGERYKSEVVIDAMMNSSSGSKELVECCLCPLAERKNRGVCAHATNDIKPDPFGRILPQFDKLSLLQSRAWNNWHDEMSERLTIHDRYAMPSRCDPILWEQAASARSEREEVLLTELQRVKTLLLACLQQAIDFGNRKRLL